MSSTAANTNGGPVQPTTVSAVQLAAAAAALQQQQHQVDHLGSLGHGDMAVVAGSAFGAQQAFSTQAVQPMGTPGKMSHQGNRSSFGLATSPTPVAPSPGSFAAAVYQPNGLVQDDLQQQQQPMMMMMDQEELEVNESVIGAVIGPSGRSIVDIQQLSGARIQISKKGTYSPGTRNRIVTIQGSGKAISTAKYMIEKQIREHKKDHHHHHHGQHHHRPGPYL